MEYESCQGSDFSFEDYNIITELSKERMESKYLKYNLTENEDYKRYKAFSQNGIIYKVSINGEIKAGCVGELIGEDFYLHKIAHDNQFSRYNTGQIALLKLIELLIGYRVKRFHFLWSKGVDYKIRFGGVPHAIWSYSFYKSHSISFYKELCTSIIMKAKFTVLDKLRKNKKFIKLFHRLKYKVSK